MSFLAQLREKNRVTERLKLHYLLNIVGERLHLRLRLSGDKTHSGAAETHFVLQVDHLRQAPTFFTDVDATICRVLYESSEQGGDGQIWILSDLVILRAMLNTERCWLESSECRYLLSFGQQRDDGVLHWIRYPHNGCQVLVWNCHPFQKVIYLDNENQSPILIDLQSAQVCEIHHAYGNAAMMYLQRWKNIEGAALSVFSEQFSFWQSQGLPAPLSLSAEILPCDFVPLVICRREHGRDVIRFGGRYLNAFFSIFSDDLSNCYFWLDDFLYQATASADMIDAWREKWLATLSSCFELDADGAWSSGEESAWLHLMLSLRSNLETQGFVFVIERGFRHDYVMAQDWRVSVQTKAAGDYSVQLEATVANQLINFSTLLHDLQNFSAALKEYHCLQLADGKKWLIPLNQWVSLQDEFLGLLPKHKKDGACLSLSDHEWHRLKALHDIFPSASWVDDGGVLKRAFDLHHPPKKLIDQVYVTATLRPYQWLGLCWLNHLYENGANGLLADDMGLGKTLQAIAFFAHLKAHKKIQAPILVVLPTSLIANWARELRQFAPQLPVKIMHGSERHAQWHQWPSDAVLLTSYTLLVNDLEQWRKQPISWIVLDEAQAIKNPSSKAAQALRQLPCERRLALSGTPVENHLGELWSIFDFLSPGILGHREQFNAHFRWPIEKSGNQQRMRALLANIAPFMLRRTKDQVATELPPKTFIAEYVSFSEAQSNLYQSLRRQSHETLVQQMSQTDHLGQKQILLLSALTQLRQLCCDPQLIGYQDIPSAKRDRCLEMLSSLVEEGRFVLLFSQFRRMLEILSENLEQMGITHFLLTGRTPRAQRQQMVEAFQQGQAPIFLISLKAGGVGLNLTRADTVIHYDPWWNLAAEKQATDRAHRIGQDKPVFVYKLIAENTLEEKITRLQNQKAILGQPIDQQAQDTGEHFALTLEEMLSMMQDEQLPEIVADSRGDELLDRGC